MEKLRARFRASFSIKVLIPVVASMVLLLGLTVFTVNQRLTLQFQSEAARSLATAEAVFRNSQKIHTKNLLLRFHNLPKEPRYRAAFQSGDIPTLRDQIEHLPADQGVDVVLFTSPNGHLLAGASIDPLIPIDEFTTNSALAVQQALQAGEKVDTVRAGDRLFDVVCFPILGISGERLGALTFGTELGNATAQEFSLVTHSQIVLLANGRVIASTLQETEPETPFATLFSDYVDGNNSAKGPKDLKRLELGGEHYFYSAGRFSSLSGDDRLGYLLLSSYEQPLQALHRTQEALLLVTALGILLDIAVVWFLVQKVTQPLRALRDSAEAVGRGDFSQRVQAESEDECGELATVFNRMTENLEHSRKELEQLVDRLKTTQAQLVQSEKLSGIGEFVAGVAHELNNPLTTVMGFSELLKESDHDPKHLRHLEMIHKSALRCQKIVQNLLSFARRHPPECKLTSVNALVEGAVEFLQYQLRTSNIEVRLQLGPSLPETMIDPHQVQQVFLNIINNARQAMESNQNSGLVRITTEVCGQNIRIIFEDNGPGIAEENLSKVFDPFFTTKEVGKGTGLGLSLCYGIIKEHGGNITARSKLGCGATFIVELPLGFDNMRQSETSPSPAERPTASRDGWGKRILVIDDEEAIVQLIRETLISQGFEVDVASDGESALRRVRQNSYDLALCDWKMPGLNGQQIYDRVRASNPVLAERFIFISGDVISDKVQKFLRERKKVCLSKPFSLTEFCAAVDKALAE